MARELRCKDAGMECDFVAKGQTDEEVMKAAAEHGRQKHGMTQITPDLQEKMQSIIHDAK